MSGSLDFTNQLIQETYQRVVQTESGSLFDGTGSVVTDLFLTSSQALTASYAHYAVSASYEIIKEESSSFADTASYVNPLNQDVIVTGSVTTANDINLIGDASTIRIRLTDDPTDSNDYSYITKNGRSLNFFTRAGSTTFESNGSGDFRFFPRGLRVLYVDYNAVDIFNGNYNVNVAKFDLTTKNSLFYGNVLIGTTTDGARLKIQGSGTTSATTSLLVENANASASLVVLDNGNTTIYGSGSIYQSAALTVTSTFSTDTPVLKITNSQGRGGYIRPTDPSGGSNGLFISSTVGEGGAGDDGVVFGTNVHPSGQFQKNLGNEGAPWNTLYVGTVRSRNNTSQGTLNLRAGTTSNPLNFYIGSTLSGRFNSGTNNYGFTLLTGSGDFKEGLTVTGSLNTSGSTNLTGSVGILGETTLYKSGSTVLDVQGSQGQLFSVIDELSGSLMSVNDVSGLPILEVFSDDRVEMGTYGAPALVVTGSDVNINSGSLNVQGQQLDAAFIWFMG